MRVLLYLALLSLTACMSNGGGERQVAWDSMNYSSHVASEPVGYFRMGK